MQARTSPCRVDRIARRLAARSPRRRRRRCSRLATRRASSRPSAPADRAQDRASRSEARCLGRHSFLSACSRSSLPCCTLSHRPRVHAPISSPTSLHVIRSIAPRAGYQCPSARSASVQCLSSPRASTPPATRTRLASQASTVRIARPACPASSPNRRWRTSPTRVRRGAPASTPILILSRSRRRREKSRAEAASWRPQGPSLPAAAARR